MQPSGTKRLGLDLNETLWNKLDLAAEAPGDKKKIVERALRNELKDIPDPGPNYQPKNPIRHKKKTRLMPALKDLYQKHSV